MTTIMDTLATCGHTYGQLVIECDGLRCPTCEHFYPYGTPLRKGPDDD